MTFGLWRHLATLSGLRERDRCTFGNTLLHIAMSHPLSGLRVRTLTINSDESWSRDRDVSMTHARLGLRIRTDTINSNYVLPTLWRTPLIPVNQAYSCGDESPPSYLSIKNIPVVTYPPIPVYHDVTINSNDEPPTWWRTPPYVSIKPIPVVTSPPHTCQLFCYYK